MDEGAVLALLALAGGGFSTLWATGGWQALRRRRIQQEIDLANGLEKGSTVRASLLEHADDQAAIYLYQRQAKPTIHKSVNGFFLAAIAIVVMITVIFPDAGDAIVYTFEAVFAASLGWLAGSAVYYTWKRNSKHRYDKLLALSGKAPKSTEGEA